MKFQAFVKTHASRLRQIEAKAQYLCRLDYCTFQPVSLTVYLNLKGIWVQWQGTTSRCLQLLDIYSRP